MFGTIFKTNNFLFVARRYAGHSKWANIKHTKGLKDAQRSRLFVKLCQRIKVAIKDGGNANPDKNLLLSQAIEVAKRQNMPTTSIQNCIKSAQVDKSSIQSHWYEVKGPSGCFIVVQALTDNYVRTRDTIAPILKKHKAVFVERACKHLFLQRGEILAVPPPELANVEESVVDHAIECGAEEVFPDENEEGTYKFICELGELSKVNSKLQQLKYNVISSDFNFIPTVKVELSDDNMDIMCKLIDKLEDHPDVVVLYDNIA